MNTIKTLLICLLASPVVALIYVLFLLVTVGFAVAVIFIALTSIWKSVYEFVESRSKKC